MKDAYNLLSTAEQRELTDLLKSLAERNFTENIDNRTRRIYSDLSDWAKDFLKRTKLNEVA